MNINELKVGDQILVNDHNTAIVKSLNYNEFTHDYKDGLVISEICEEEHNEFKFHRIDGKEVASIAGYWSLGRTSETLRALEFRRPEVRIYPETFNRLDLIV